MSRHEFSLCPLQSIGNVDGRAPLPRLLLSRRVRCFILKTNLPAFWLILAVRNLSVRLRNWLRTATPQAS